MKKHTKIYLTAFKFKIPEDCFCEICGLPAVDIHHIENRKAGGDPTGDKDKIENLMALCRNCHIEFGDVVKAKIWLTKVHLKFMIDNGVKIN